MAAPTVRGVGAFGSGTTSFVAAVPTGGSAPVAGDAMYIVMESTDSTTTAGTPSTPGGWSSLFEQTWNSGSSTEPAVMTLTIFGKIAGAGETDVTVSGVGNHCAGAMVVIADHGLGAITNTVVGTATANGTTTTGCTTGGITVQAGSLIILAVAFSDDANDTTNISNVANANLASITERIDQTVSTGAGGGVGIYTATCAGTTTGSTTYDHDTAANSSSVQLGVWPQILGTTTSTLNALTVSGTATLGPPVGTFNVTLAAVTVSGSGTVDVQGTSAITLGTLTLAGAAGVDVVGTFNSAFDAATVSGTGVVTAGGSTGDAAITLSDSTLSSSATIPINGAFSSSLDAAIASATATIFIQGVFDSSLNAALLSGAGATLVTGTSLSTLDSLGLSGSATSPIFGTLDQTLEAMTAAGQELVDTTVFYRHNISLSHIFSLRL